MPIIVLPETGNVYVQLPELRALPNLASFTDDELAEAREWFETTFEDYVGMAFVPRTATERLTGRCSTIMLEHWPVRSITAVRSYTSPSVYTEFTGDELADLQADATGEIKRYAAGYWPADIEVDYVHGQAAPPADVVKAAKVAIQERLMEDRSARPADRTYGVATEQGIVRNILPGKDRPFGIADVDAVANRYRAKYHLPGIG